MVRDKRWILGEIVGNEKKEICDERVESNEKRNFQFSRRGEFCVEFLE